MELKLHHIYLIQESFPSNNKTIYEIRITQLSKKHLKIIYFESGCLRWFNIDGFKKGYNILEELDNGY